MKGIVFAEFIEMVEDAFSPEIADRIIEESDLESGGAYTAVGTYPHEELVAMVVRLSEITETPAGDLVKAFGRHLFSRFVSAYPAFFEGLGSSFEFLETIENHVHVEVRKLYPDAELPTFDCVRDGNTLTMTYRSKRQFADLAEGLIEGSIAHWGESIELHREELDGAEDQARFLLKRLG